MPSRRKRLAVLLTALLTLGAGSVLAGSSGTTVAQEPARNLTQEPSGTLAQESAQDPEPVRPGTRAVSAASTTAEAPSRRTSDKTAANETRTTAANTSAVSRASDRSRDSKILPDRMRGPAAVRALGDDLPAAASRSGVSAAQLRRVLTTDRTAWVSEIGRLFYMENAPQLTTGTTSAATVVAPAFDSSKTFVLNSLPGATRTIFLDFNGATVSGTDWNIGADAITAGTHSGYSSDSTTGAFSTAEHGYIQEVWRQVSETYAAFDVNVTTQDPGSDAYTRTSTTDPTYGTHVVITSSKTPKTQVCPRGCLGVAFLNTFNEIDPTAYLQPAWVFADPTNPDGTVGPAFDPMIIAQAASHEAGHTLGLKHDATNANTNYYAGTRAWGPIMGSAMMRAVSQFSRGEYGYINDKGESVYANNKEDDFAVITSNGLPLRTDDHGNDPAGAQQLGELPAYTAAGVISTRTDKDVFAINLPCTSTLGVTATGVGAQTTLDLSLEVIDSAGAVVTSSPTSSNSWPYGTPAPISTNMNASVTVPTATGTYYLRVDGVGSGLATGTGWSDYGSLGQYSLTATGCATGGDATASTTPSPSPTPTTAPTTPTTTVTLAPVPAATKPGPPVIGKASSGYSGGTVSATARWAAPSNTGGAAITKYRVRAQKRDSRNRVIRTYYSGYYGSTTRALVWRLPRGRYSFTVMAWNRVGASAWSRSSAIVTAR